MSKPEQVVYSVVPSDEVKTKKKKRKKCEHKDTKCKIKVRTVIELSSIKDGCITISQICRGYTVSKASPEHCT